MDAMDEVYLKGTVPPCMELAAFNHWACVGLEYIMGNDADGKNQIRQLVEFFLLFSDLDRSEAREQVNRSSASCPSTPKTHVRFIS